MVDIPFKWLHQKSCLIPIRLNPVIFSVTKFSHPLFHKIWKFKVSSFSFSVEPSIERFPQLEEVRSPYRDGVRMDADSFVKRWSAPAADTVLRDAFAPYTLHHETVYLMKMKSKFELHWYFFTLYLLVELNFSDRRCGFLSLKMQGWQILQYE